MAHPPSARRRGARAGFLAVALAALLALPGLAAGADTSAPTLTLPGDLTSEATGPQGASVAYEASARDDVDRSVRVTCDPESGSQFPLGVTSVACRAADRAGNVIEGSFTVTVTDTTAPVLSLPADLPVEASGPSGALVRLPVSAIDAVAGAVTVTCAPDSGPFPLGPTAVECSAVDPVGNRTTGGFAVTVSDTTPPLVDIPADMLIRAPSAAGAVVSYRVSAGDDVDGPVAASCAPAPDLVFPLGVTTVTCAAADAAGNRSSRSFRVTVAPPDDTPPLIDVPRDIVVEPAGPGGAAVDYLAPGDDDVDGPVPVSCTPLSGSTFPIGTTKVTCTATDRAGNAGSRSFLVTVRDGTAPVIDLPADPVVEAAGPGGAAVTYLAGATDAIDGALPVECSVPSGATFPVGATAVSCKSVDAAGNARTGAFTVTVRDTTPPAISVPGSLTVLPVSEAGAPVTYEASAIDAVSGSVVVSCTPSSGSTFPLGTTQVRCVAADQAGNSAGTGFAVTVAAQPTGS
jgi:HYR domain-containing protein